MQVNPYLNFDGHCAAAFRFYAQTFGGQLVALMTHGESPAAKELSPEWHDRVTHARLVIGDTVLMGSDSPPGKHTPAQGIYVNVAIEKPSDADRVFAALAHGGKVEMPIQQTFWAARFGMCVDRYGIPWMVNCEGRED